VSKTYRIFRADGFETTVCPPLFLDFLFPGVEVISVSLDPLTCVVEVPEDAELADLGPTYRIEEIL